MTPLERLSAEAKVTVGEMSYSTYFDARPNARLWHVGAEWSDYHGSTLFIEREGQTVRDAAEAIEARKAELDAEWRTGTDRRAA